MTPYYDHGGITIYHGDCREVMPILPYFDLLLMDPPYGIAEVWKGGAGHGWGATRSQTSERNSWDGTPPTPDTVTLCLSKAEEAVIWGGNYFSLPPSRGWLVWNKPERGFSLSEAELAWTSRRAVVRVKDLPRHTPFREHPTEKPLELMKWCLGLFPTARSILDPFMGSGPVLIAAKDLGRRAIGIEIEERYCEIAAKRLSQEILPLEATR